MLIKLWRATYNGIYAFLVGAVLKLRYRMQVEGMKTLNLNPKQGCLFLANHVAEIDPVILEYLFWRRFYVRPMAVEYLFHSRIVRWFLNSVRSIPIPQVVLGKENKRTLERINKCYEEATVALNKGESILLYPSGKLSRTGKEEIVNQYSAYVLLHKIAECNVVLVRIAGLWGSAFSRYKLDSTPKLASVFKKALRFLLRRGIFFMPKRFVRITLCQVDHFFLKQFPTRQDLNTFLASWFNQEDDNLPIEVPYA
ncbi:2-acyl-glycerophospho-ethanolamine acyltransferase,1-acylglycerol-3-phosphate O-acyltransferases,Acyltransferase [Chlamydia serpentis]|uniref:2-acyl-glycerophospho-ethanolamine acyltransferase,1-acylglycerol-3-phosphate O-acyltransferases,Acyltransferase n=1 Tax=Chlamydia serpentis TaxID=1967782 RepID=A0A2R8FCE5_9CHLA|nr:1-acyl-sn-glycerol-3-phosphate acyltransferase [Chlamydia serpentis]SPN74031.1 2-acyl-glycerophospho-ethanolamine acyltransferase,1-acylglycerol-3-phosphate O-acyltransferases,Acyltransferase [Chlamydia serpentis]